MMQTRSLCAPKMDYNVLTYSEQNRETRQNVMTNPTPVGLKEEGMDENTDARTHL